MVAILRSALALLALQVVGSFAAVDVDASVNDGAEAAAEAAAAEGENAVPDLKVDVVTTFPEIDKTLGLKLVNGKPTKALVQLTNYEEEPVRLALIGGALSTLDPLPADAPPTAAILANLSAASYEQNKASILQPGEVKAFPYNFVLDLMPREIQVNLMGVVAKSNGKVFQLPLHSEKAAIVDAPMSIFDPQIIFLYVFLTGVFGATLFFVYKTWIEALFPQAKRSGAGRKGRKAVEPAAAPAAAATADAALSGNESTGAGTGGEEFDASWIPAHHLNKPVAKRVKSGPAKKKASE